MFRIFRCKEGDVKGTLVKLNEEPNYLSGVLYPLHLLKHRKGMKRVSERERLGDGKCELKFG